VGGIVADYDRSVVLARGAVGSSSARTDPASKPIYLPFQAKRQVSADHLTKMSAVSSRVFSSRRAVAERA
jgi:hypothetical protein